MFVATRVIPTRQKVWIQDRLIRKYEITLSLQVSRIRLKFKHALEKKMQIWYHTHLLPTRFLLESSQNCLNFQWVKLRSKGKKWRKTTCTRQSSKRTRALKSNSRGMILLSAHQKATRLTLLLNQTLQPTLHTLFTNYQPLYILRQPIKLLFPTKRKV